MRYQSIQTYLVTLLGAQAASRYRTVGYVDRSIADTEVYNTSKLVSVVYKSGMFPEGLSGHQGPATHECTFNIELLLSQPAKVDVATLESGSATAGERSTALAALQDAKNLANSNLDAFISIIYYILLDNESLDFGLTRSYVGNRWISKIEKADPMYFGDSVISAATITFNVDVQEDFTGDTGDSGDKIDLTLELNSEDDGQTGVSTNL